jgi:hypothetical protein
MQKVIESRAAEMTLPDGTEEAAGGSTGLLVRTEKVIGTGDKATKITEYAVDTALLKELRAHEQQAAQELGQWLEKKELSGPDGGPVQVDLSVLTDEELDLWKALADKVTAGQVSAGK